MCVVSFGQSPLSGRSIYLLIERATGRRTVKLHSVNMGRLLTVDCTQKERKVSGDFDVFSETP